MKNARKCILLPFMLLAIAPALVGCAGVQVRQAPLASVHKAAIVAFGYSVDLSTESDKDSSSAIGNIVNASKAIAEASDPETREVVPRAAYEALSKKVGGSLSWAMLSAQDVAANPEVQQIVTSIKIFGDSPAITGVMHPYQADRLTPAQRKDLFAKLGVDALLVADVKIRCGGTSGFALGGMGKVTKYPQASITLSVYGAQDEEPIWRDRMATGDKAPTGIATTMGVQVDETRNAALAEATASALDKLMARYREVAGAPAAK
jgi:hypothetical protein